MRSSTPAVEIPKLPTTARAWDGPAVLRAIEEKGLTVHVIGLALDRHPTSVTRWTLPAGHANANNPTIEVACDLAAILGKRLDDFLVEVERSSGKPLRLLS